MSSSSTSLFLPPRELMVKKVMMVRQAAGVMSMYASLLRNQGGMHIPHAMAYV